ncbi:hypothetical protein SAMN05428957_103281 [Oryzisolibacter propanilivorax]|uniref:TubC N-terminal docking domain-containing protein n=1 Tax=Oryzisolibacter propanilivorax TaxID=1527607 RepID=A0A1G9RHP8_9BURK|nr:hypothetical protein [Oryzisolibacter propanilivorax]SDM22701.1 hypothetical protein SAMN05428957_103281 [Oryzisolibacter propanilivorax]
MTPDALLRDLLQAGIEPGLTPDGENITVPAGRLTDTQRAAIRQFKRELIERLQESARLTTELLAASMRACDHWGDSAEAREQMRQDVLATPHHLRADLLEHLQREYGRPRHAD